MYRWTLRLIYSILCTVLAATCAWFAVESWRTWGQADFAYRVVLIVAFLLFSSTAASVARDWRIGAWLAAATGAILLLYCLSVVLMGWEDVGGARGAIPLALGTGLSGVLGLAIGLGTGLERGEAA
jgi:peptidoglycan/LPS O-acetylase OafA/YrhL